MRSIAGRGRSVHLAPVEEVDREPSAVELAEIEREMPLILAEAAVIDADVLVAMSPGSVWAQRRHRRACRQVLAATRALANGGPVPGEVA